MAQSLARLVANAIRWRSFGLAWWVFDYETAERRSHDA